MFRKKFVVAAITVLNICAVLFGAEAAPSETQASNQKLLEEKIAQLNRLQSEIDQLREDSGSAQQIRVTVQVFEVSRTKMHELGIDWARVVDSKGGNAANITAANKSNDSGITFGLFDRTDAFLGFVEAIQKSNAARILANPALVILSGRPATFQVGGEMPLPAAPGSGKSEEFQSFGTKLDVMAVALGNKNIRMELRVRLAERDYAHSVQIAGAQVPQLNIREVDTAFELKAGQSAFLNGLVQTRTEAIDNGGVITTKPIEVETWFIVTPELVPTIASSSTTVRE